MTEKFKMSVAIEVQAPGRRRPVSLRYYETELPLEEMLAKVQNLGILLTCIDFYERMRNDGWTAPENPGGPAKQKP